MARPSRATQRRAELLPLVAQAFAELGYRRATTAALAARCGIQENVLYRLWRDKREMFSASIAYVYERSIEIWRDVLAGDAAAERATERLLAYESEHHGEFGLYRIIFAGLSETDDPEIRAALRATYRHFHQFISERIAARDARPADAAPGDAAPLTAWAIIGLGTIANIGRELGLLDAAARRRLIADVGRGLLALDAPGPTDGPPRRRRQPDSRK